MNMDKKIILAMAVSNAGYFQAKHFGDADKYEIYEWDNDSFFYLNEINNSFKAVDEEQEHGLQKKGEAIIDLLKNEGVKILVSKQFGKNIQMVNRHFIPVIVYTKIPEMTLSALNNHMKWIMDEFNNSPEEFKLFTIKSGILKTTIKKEK
jgi:predicted Fe-Mo cluster-binding NifX family protein